MSHGFIHTQLDKQFDVDDDGDEEGEEEGEEEREGEGEDGHYDVIIICYSYDVLLDNLKGIHHTATISAEQSCCPRIEPTVHKKGSSCRMVRFGVHEHKI